MTSVGHHAPVYAYRPNGKPVASPTISEEAPRTKAAMRRGRAWGTSRTYAAKVAATPPPRVSNDVTGAIGPGIESRQPGEEGASEGKSDEAEEDAEREGEGAVLP